MPAEFQGLVVWAVDQLAAIDQRAQALCPSCLGITGIPSSLINGGLLSAPAVAPQVPVPVAVIVSEYVDIAKAFYSEDEPKLVNAVLDRVSRRVRGEGRGKDAS